MTEITINYSMEHLFDLIEEGKNIGIVALIIALFAVVGLGLTVLLLTQGDKNL